MLDMREIQKENVLLREENEKLQKEVELEHRIYQNWKHTAVLFHDALWKALTKYDPEQYVEKRQHENG